MIGFTLLILILLFHAGELAYFIFYLPIFFICFADKLRSYKKYVLYGTAFTIAVIYFGIKIYKNQIPMLLTLIKNGAWQQMVVLIDVKGTWNVVGGGNRYAGNWNEMYRFSVYTLLGVAGLVCFNLVEVHKRVIAFIALSLIFCFAPSYVFSAGFLSLISYDAIVNRYYSASFLFLALPLCIYLMIKKFKFFNHPVYIIITTIVAVGAVYSYSKFFNNQGVFYQNIKSITTSIKAKKLDVEISELEIIDIGKQIQIAESVANASDFMYCGPYKKIHMIAYLYNRKNVYFDRGQDYSLSLCEEVAKK
jgi:hypothetical protein